MRGESKKKKKKFEHLERNLQKSVEFCHEKRDDVMIVINGQSVSLNKS